MAYMRDQHNAPRINDSTQRGYGSHSVLSVVQPQSNRPSSWESSDGPTGGTSWQRSYGENDYNYENGGKEPQRDCQQTEGAGYGSGGFTEGSGSSWPGGDGRTGAQLQNHIRGGGGGQWLGEGRDSSGAQWQGQERDDSGIHWQGQGGDDNGIHWQGIGKDKSGISWQGKGRDNSDGEGVNNIGEEWQDKGRGQTGIRRPGQDNTAGFGRGRGLGIHVAPGTASVDSAGIDDTSSDVARCESGSYVSGGVKTRGVSGLHGPFVRNERILGQHGSRMDSGGVGRDVEVEVASSPGGSCSRLWKGGCRGRGGSERDRGGGELGIGGDGGRPMRSSSPAAIDDTADEASEQGNDNETLSEGSRGSPAMQIRKCQTFSKRFVDCGNAVSNVECSLTASKGDTVSNLEEDKKDPEKKRNSSGEAAGPAAKRSKQAELFRTMILNDNVSLAPTKRIYVVNSSDPLVDKLQMLKQLLNEEGITIVHIVPKIDQLSVKATIHIQNVYRFEDYNVTNVRQDGKVPTKNKSFASNLLNMKRMMHSMPDVKIPIELMVLTKHESDKNNKSEFTCLELSATRNLMLLECETLRNPDLTFTCTISLQGKILTTQVDSTPNGAKRLCSEVIMNNLKKTQNIIYVTSRFPGRAITTRELLSNAPKKKKLLGEPPAKVVFEMIKDHKEDPAEEKEKRGGQASLPETEIDRSLFPWIAAAVYEILDEYYQKITLEDLIMNLGDMHKLQAIVSSCAAKMGLRMVRKSRISYQNGNNGTFLTRILTAQDMDKILQLHGGGSGRFKLVSCKNPLSKEQLEKFRNQCLEQHIKLVDARTNDTPDEYPELSSEVGSQSGKSGTFHNRTSTGNKSRRANNTPTWNFSHRAPEAPHLLTNRSKFDHRFPAPSGHRPWGESMMLGARPRMEPYSYGRYPFNRFYDE